MPRLRTVTPFVATVLGLTLGLTLAQAALAADLLQSFEAALEQDTGMRAARASQQSAHERLPQANAQMLPNISLGVSRNQNDIDRTQQSSTGKEVRSSERYYSYNQTLQLRQPLYRKQLLINRNEAIEAGKQADALVSKEAQNLAVKVTSAYLEALLAQDQLDLILKERELIVASLDAARKSVHAGSGTRTDVDEAQAQLDLNRAQELDARQNFELSSRTLQSLTQQKAAVLARLAADRLVPHAPDPDDLDHWISEAQANSPDLLARQAEVNAAQLEIDKAQAGHYPTLDAVAMITRSGSETVTSPDSSYVDRILGVQLNVPLYSGGGVSSAVRQAIAEQAKAQELLESARRELALQVSREYFGLRQGLAKWQALQQAELSARQLVISSRKSQQAGVRTVLDVLNAEHKLQMVLRDLAQARYQYIRAWVALHTLAGRAPMEAVSAANSWFE
ncbi:TolC family outer membrane protein [Aquabacterium sp.]|uniref:TolC family outer membrane protein n=1 Tax=Aquabacterium sp. TaxID=1872578 RepID=UPI0035B374AC